MSERSNIMIQEKALDNLDDEVEGYFEGILVDAERIDQSTARLIIEDKETGDQYEMEDSSMSSHLGSVKSYLPPEDYEDVEAVEPAEIAKTILDTRDSGLRFYYYRPNATPV